MEQDGSHRCVQANLDDVDFVLFTHLRNERIDKTAHAFFFFLAHLGSAREEAKTEALRQCSSLQKNLKLADGLSLTPPCSLPRPVLSPEWLLRVGPGHGSSAG